MNWNFKVTNWTSWLPLVNASVESTAVHGRHLHTVDLSNNQIRDEGLPGIMGPAGTCWDLGCELERLWESSRHLKFSNLFPGNIGNTWKILKRLAITKVSCLRKMICGAGWDNICIRCYSRLYWQTRWAPIIEAMSWSTSWQTNTLVKSVVTQLSLFLKVFGSISKRCAASTAILMVLCRCHDLGGEHEVAESGPEALNGKDRLGNIHCKIHWTSRNYDDGNDSKCRNSEQNKCW